jgi:hypothetical protein
MEAILAILITSLFVISCGKGSDGVDGTDGTNGIDGTNGVNGKVGINGTNGIDGKDGINGVDGKDGINGRNGTNGTNGTNGLDNKIVYQVSCMGSITSDTSWNNASLYWNMNKTNSGDVFSIASITGSSYSYNGSSFYSNTQVGASTGPVIITMKIGVWAIIQFNNEINNITAEFFGLDPTTTTNTDACTMSEF